MPSSKQIAEWKKVLEQQKTRSTLERNIRAFLIRYQDILGATSIQEAASDIAQNALILASTRLSQFRGKSSLETWLHRIAINTALSWIARQSTSSGQGRVVSFDRATHCHEEARSQISELIHSKDPSPHEAYVSAEVLSDVAIALIGLKRKNRYQYEAVVAYNAVEKKGGGRYKAAAKLLDLTVPAFKSLLSRARKSLRALLGHNKNVPRNTEQT